MTKMHYEVFLIVMLHFFLDKGTLKKVTIVRSVVVKSIQTITLAPTNKRNRSMTTGLRLGFSKERWCIET